MMKKTSHMIWIAVVYLRNGERHTVEVAEVVSQRPVSIDEFLTAVNSAAQERVQNDDRLDNFYVASINVEQNNERIIIE